MSVQCEIAAQQAAGAELGFFERWLTLWVFLAILVGIVAGQFAVGPVHILGGLEIAQVNLPVGLLIWLMIVPMLMKIDFAAIRQVRRHWRGIGITLFVNWAVKPFSMALLGWLFIRGLFAPYLPPAQLDSYVAGLILLAAAPCTAMVFVWSHLAKGEPLFTLTQVALNDSIMVVAFAPIVALLLGVASITVPWDTLFLSVVMYIVIPLAIAQALRWHLLRRGRLDAVLAHLHPMGIGALLATLVLLFAFQGEAILRQPLIIAMLALPILIQVYFNSMLAYWLNRQVREAHCVAGPSALIGASNFFELAVAAAISLYGFQSGAALATVVGVLIEVPVMLSVVAIVNRSRGWYEAGLPPAHSLAAENEICAVITEATEPPAEEGHA
jgi:ACR3 family arsenite transporter